jgi:hypothetical protein
MRHRTVIIAGRHEPDSDRRTLAGKKVCLTLEVVQRVCDGQSATTFLARNADQNLMACLEMSIATSKIEAAALVAVDAGLLGSVVMQNHE